jgi:TrmH family RNA methyltransferase
MAHRFIVEGERINLRAVRAGVLPEKLVVAESCLASPTPEIAELLERLGSTGEVASLPDRDLIEFAHGRNSGQVVGVFSARGNFSIEHLAHVEDPSFLALVLVDVEEPGNVGALTRTALAGFANIVVCVGVTDPFHPKAVRTSMGSLFRVPVLRVPTIEPVLDVTRNFRRLAAIAAGGIAPWQVEARGPTALFVGNEARGLPEAVASAVGCGVTIPMQQAVDSYSVNAATAILLYELSTARVRNTAP